MLNRMTKLVGNHYALQAEATSADDTFKNQKIRYSSVKEIKINETIRREDIEATQKFWCMQTYFFIKCLQDNKSQIIKLFPDTFPADMPLSKENIIFILKTVIEELSKEKLTNEEISHLIDIFVPHDVVTSVEKKEDKISEKTDKISKKEEKLSEKNDIFSEHELPCLYIQKRDSIMFSYEQAAQHKKVLIMDAANTQRPGAGAYEKGTFQEALTRSTDLYWQILVDFRNVLQDLQEQKKTHVKIEEKDYKAVNVPAFQARFLKLILFFVKKSIEDDMYLTKAQFRKDFFDYAEGIYGDIQNRVLEIPSDQGFLKEALIVDTVKFKTLKKTSDLFDEKKMFNLDLLEEKSQKIFIMEVAAPDKRYVEGLYDRASTFNKDLQVCYQKENAEKMIRYSIKNTLEHAIRKDVDTIILNGFGCGAFLNSPQEVAAIFAEALTYYKLQLRDKSIYFMDISSHMCQIFGNIFSKTLRGNFNINLYQPSQQINLYVLIEKLRIQSIIQKDEVIIAASNSKMIRKSFTFLGKSPDFSNIRTIKDLDNQPKTKVTLKKAYSKAILSAIEEKKTIIHMPLIGTGQLNFSAADSISALEETLQHLGQSSDFPHIKIYVYILPENIEHYHKMLEHFITAQQLYHPVKNSRLMLSK